MKYCYKCGHQMEDDMLFCQKCGTKAVENTHSDTERPYAKGRSYSEPRYAQQSAAVERHEPNNISSTKSKKKTRKGLKGLSIFCFFGTAVVLIASITDPTLFFGALMYLVLGVMFLVLSKSPKESKYLLGRTSGIKKSLFVLICVLVVFAVVAVGVSLVPSDAVNSESTPPPISSEKSPIDSSAADHADYIIDVEDLVAEINEDIEAAGRKYNEKKIEITGTVTYISDSAGMTGYYLYGTRGAEGLKITCWVYDENAVSLKVGDTATFIGIMREVTTFNNTELGDCVLKQQPTIKEIEAWYNGQLPGVSQSLVELSKSVEGLTKINITDSTFRFGEDSGWYDCHYTLYFTCKVDGETCTGEARAFMEYKGDEISWFHFEIFKDADWSSVVEHYDASYDQIIEAYYKELVNRCK